MPRLPMGDMSAAEVIWGYGTSYEIVITPHLGRISLKDTVNAKDIQEESYGDNAVDARETGRPIEISVPMTRSTLEQLEAALGGVLDSYDILIISADISCAGMYERSLPLLIKPKCGAVADPDHKTWIEVFHTYPVPAIDLGWARDEQRVFLVNFKTFISQESEHEGELYSIGVL